MMAIFSKNFILDCVILARTITILLTHLPKFSTESPDCGAERMKSRFALCAVVLSCVELAPGWAWGEDLIRRPAWHRAIGAPLSDPGTKNRTVEPRDLAYVCWQGAPIAG